MRPTEPVKIDIPMSNNSINAQIQDSLRAIAEEKGIRILLACETGSRAWGFPSPDSDYDIRMLYVHELDWYLGLAEGKDNLSLMLADGELDITGWELRKSLRLLQRSNVALLERIQSPIIYAQEAGFVQNIQQLALAYYSKIAVMHHYLSMAEGMFTELKTQEEYKLKKFFYVLRSATACWWIMERDDIPPIVFQEMLNGLPMPKDLEERILELIALKATVGESYLHKGEVHLFSHIAGLLEKARSCAQSLPAAKGDKVALENLFRDTIKRT